MTAPVLKRGGALGQQGAPAHGTRAVLLDPGKSLERMAVVEYATRRNLDVVCVAGELADAIHEITHGRAEVILVLRTNDLRPLIRIVTEPDEDDVPDHLRRTGRRRPQRLSR